MGFTYLALSPLSLSNPLISPDSERLAAMRLEVGELIRNLRSRRGLTQAALASLARVHRTYLSRVERGRVTPSIFTLMQIAGAVGVQKITLRVRVPPTRSAKR